MFHRTPTVLLLLFVAGTATAQVPGQINFQGLLLDASGAPVNGLVDLDFALFDTEAGGNALWTESHLDVDVIDGVYDVALGSTTAIDASVLSGSKVYLEIDVEGETLTPRQRLLAVPYAIRAENADNVNGLSGVFVTELFEHFDFDGGAPANDDPSEGLGDTDGDGIANFVDPDNDDDGLSDGVEVAQGSDINLVTPAISGFDPSAAEGSVTSSVEVQGTGFLPGLSVVFGSETPTPTNVTATSFDVSVGPQSQGAASVIVTNPNGESGNGGFAFGLATPVITGFAPSTADGFVTTNVEVQGTGFLPGLSVVFGGETPTPANVTATSFDVSVGPQSEGTTSVVVTNPNANVGSADFVFFLLQPIISGFSPSKARPSATTTVTISGQNFSAGLSVVFGSETPTPTNITPTSFDVVVGPQPAGVVNVTVTLTNGKSTMTSFPFLTERKVFVSSALYDGDLGGLSGADASCTALAAAVGETNPYVAWLADSTQSPSTRFDLGGSPYTLLGDGTTIANDWTDLTDGTLDNKINKTESGGGIVSLREVWTNVDASGANNGNDHCSDWSSTSGNGRAGVQNASDSRWTDDSTRGCSQNSRIYCFEE